jgi:hypothetical protein
VSGHSRKSVPLDGVGAALLEAIRETSSPERLALEEAVGPLPSSPSEAKLLSALIAYAANRLAEARLDDSYRSLAASRDAEDALYETAIRARRGRLAD